MYYGYKIINKINGKFYIGVHEGSGSSSDHYMGSGAAIWNSYRKRLGRPDINKDKPEYHRLVHLSGIYEKIILTSFDNKSDMYEWEKSVVTEELIKDPNCYNLTLGGDGGFYHINSDPEIHKLAVIRRKDKGSYSHAADHLNQDRSKYDAKRWSTWYSRGKHTEQADRINTLEAKENARISRNRIRCYIRPDGRIYKGRSCSAKKIMNRLGESWIELTSETISKESTLK